MCQHIAVIRNIDSLVKFLDDNLLYMIISQKIGQKWVNNEMCYFFSNNLCRSRIKQNFGQEITELMFIYIKNTTDNVSHY